MEFLVKKIRYAFLGLALLLIPACGTGSGVCSVDTDCPGTEKCLWMKRQGQVIGQRCVVKCSTANDCGGALCNGTAVTCPNCNDNTLICEQ